MGKRVLFGKLRVYIGHRCCATIGVWLFLIFVAHYKIVRRERSISGLRAGIKIPVGLRNAPAGAVTVPGPHGGCHNAICRKAQRRPGGWPPYCGAGFHIKFMICSKAKAHGTMQASSPTNLFFCSRQNFTFLPLQYIFFLVIIQKTRTAPDIYRRCARFANS